ncbi:MAG: OsmC family protein [Candidatus Rifleibacteriota bacterium]
MAQKSYKAQLKQLNKFKIEASVGSHKLIIDQPESGGGENAGPSPLEFILSGLGGCIVTMMQVASRKKRIEMRSLEVEVEGILDTDGITGKNPDVRTGFSEVIVKVKLDADLTEEEKLAFIKEAEERCPASDNIAHETKVTLKLA